MFVVSPTGAQTMLELAEEFVERMPLGLVVPISCGATAGRGAQRGQCPDRAHGGQPPVFDMAVQHNGLLPLARVNRIDHPAGSAQRGQPRVANGFDPHRDQMPGAVVLSKHTQGSATTIGKSTLRRARVTASHRLLVQQSPFLTSG